MMVKRYHIYEPQFADTDVKGGECGGYVKYVDFEKLETENQRLREALEVKDE